MFEFHLGNYYWKTGDFDSAMVCFNRVIQLDSGFREVYTNIAFVYILQEEYSKAKEFIENVH